MKIQVIIIMYIQVNNIIDDYQISCRGGGGELVGFGVRGGWGGGLLTLGNKNRIS